MCFPFMRKKPQEWIMSMSFSSPRESICSGVLATLNSSAVTLFTCLSVHWAESITATSSS